MKYRKPFKKGFKYLKFKQMTNMQRRQVSLFTEINNHTIFLNLNRIHFGFKYLKYLTHSCT